jgi:cyclopropane fatty-acyl-phospholipid synthase-like methyltransferase
MAWYKEMFASYDPARLEVYAESETSRQQVDFVIDKLALEPGARVLDLCCGQGRHLIDLARRGYDVVGLDLSEYMLAECKTAAAAEGVNPVLVHADMREIGYTSEFDAVINMFTAFGYLENENEDQKVIDAASLALKGGGSLLVDLMNRDRLMNVFKPIEWHENPIGDLILSERDFDPITGRINAREVTIHSNGRRSERSHSLRLYTFNELENMLQQAGLTVQSTYGDFDSTPFNRGSRRMIVIARKET